MSGLLGDTWDDPRTIATMQAAQGLLTGRGSSMQRLSGGLLDYGQSLRAAQAIDEERKRREEESRQLVAMRAAEVEKLKSQMAEAAQKQAKTAAYEQALRGVVRSPNQQAMDLFGGPTQAAASAAPGMKPQVDQQALLDVMLKFNMPGALEMLKPKEVEIKEFREIRMPDGSVQVVGFGKDGKPVQTGQMPFKSPEVRDFGGHVGGIDPITGKVIKYGDKTQSPDSLASNAVTMRGQDMIDLRAREGNAITMQNGKIPPGYRMKIDGTLEAIPGGPADIKAGAEGAKAEAKKTSTLDQVRSVLETVQEAKDLVGLNTAGYGGFLANLPATEARDLQNKLTTIKANLGFDRLQQMRDQSPTGGALGQVAVQEINALQATVSSLDQQQSPAQLKAALDKIERHYQRWQEIAGGATGGATGDFSGKQKPRSINELLKQYGG